jgi:hypothetical protein
LWGTKTKIGSAISGQKRKHSLGIADDQDKTAVDELQLKPWQWTPIIDPDEGASDYPSDTAGGQRHPQAMVLWRELERAAA